MSDNVINYPQMWKTLLRTGIKERFAQIRKEFFMKIAVDGPRVYKGLDDLEEILKESPLSGKREENVPDIREYAVSAIKEDDSFKHYYYQTTDKTFFVEYFANKSRGITQEVIDKVKLGVNKDDVDGFCYSMLSEADCDNRDEGVREATPTYHFILISENGTSPESYPMIIKHELTHACLYEIRNLIHSEIIQNRGIPTTWSDEDRDSWVDDLLTLYDILKGDTEEKSVFVEFICEFLMYESDGPIKVKNPTLETKTKNVKSDTKSKITYRTLTPMDRFMESLELFTDYYRERYEQILQTLEPFYENYDKFLDIIRL